MDQKLKHLEFIQGVINRLSTNSFLLKGWSVLLVSALFALSAGNANISYVFLAYIPTIAFWALDAYFLALERGYRRLYETVRLKDPDEIDFVMSADRIRHGFFDWADALLSKTQIVFHGALLVAVVLVMVLQL